MVSPWQIPLSVEEHTTSRVVVYFYSNKLGVWIPIVFFPLVEALELNRKGLLYGAEFLVFPADLDSNAFLTELYCGSGDWAIQNSKFPIQNSKFPIQNSKFPNPQYPVLITNDN